MQAKNNFIPHALLEILQRYANFLFWVHWACLVAHTQNDSINLYKTLMFFCMQKTNFIIHFILEILHFKESYNLIGCSNLRTRILPDMRLVVKYQQQYINNNSFHFRLFPRKFKDKISKKSKKNLFWDTLFTQIRAKMNCPGKKSSISF